MTSTQTFDSRKTAQVALMALANKLSDEGATLSHTERTQNKRVMKRNDWEAFYTRKTSAYISNCLENYQDNRWVLITTIA